MTPAAGVAMTARPAVYSLDRMGLVNNRTHVGGRGGEVVYNKLAAPHFVNSVICLHMMMLSPPAQY